MYRYIYIYTWCLKNRKARCVYDFDGTDLFTTCLVGVPMNGTDVFSICLCNAPLFLKIDITVFLRFVPRSVSWARVYGN